MKESRWYEIKNGVAYIYDAPIQSNAKSVSMVDPEDLALYRRIFCLRRVWAGEDDNEC